MAQAPYLQALRDACHSLDTHGPMVTHRLRHTFATSLLNGGMSLVGGNEAGVRLGGDTRGIGAAVWRKAHLPQEPASYDSVRAEPVWIF